MTSLTGYIQGLGNGEKRTVDKQGKEIKLSVFDNIDRVIVFNEAGETSQTTLTGRNLLNPDNLSASGITIDDGVVSGTTSNFFNAFSHYNGGIPNLPTFEANTAYTLSLQIKYDENTYPAGTKGMGFRVEYTDNTAGVLIFYVTLQNTSYISLSGTTNPNKTVREIAVITAEGGSVIVYLKDIQLEKNSQATPYEPYCGGIPSPNPSYPQNIIGIGTKRPDGTYKVNIDYYDEREERSGRITASGLAYPLYEGDVLDFVNGKVIRANGYGQMTYSYLSGLSSDNIGYQNNVSQVGGSSVWVRNWNYQTAEAKKSGGIRAYCNSYKISMHDSDIIGTQNRTYLGYSGISSVADFLSEVQTLENNGSGLFICYALATPTDEYITLTGDISDIGTATVTADGTLTVKYDKVEMAVRKYSSPPDWSKIGYSGTPSFILDGFDYSKQIYDSWTSAASYASKFRGDKALKFFPEVDLTGATNYSAMFQESGILSTPPLTIGDGSNTVIDSRWMFQDSPIEKIELKTSDSAQKAQITNIFSGCSNLKNAKLTLSASGSMESAFADCTQLERIEDGLETSDVTSFSEAFRACSSLLYLYELDLSSCTTCYRAFYNCTSLYSAPYLKNIGNGVNFQQMFWNCSSLRTIPPYNLHSPNNLTNMFQGTGSNLEEASRNNILMMLAACTYSGTKTLAHLGFNSSMYSAASWQALPGYNSFVSAGWSIGYT